MSRDPGLYRDPDAPFVRAWGALGALIRILEEGFAPADRAALAREMQAHLRQVERGAGGGS